MKNYFRRGSLALLLGSFLLSCTDDYFEFDNIGTGELRPEFAFPLVNSTLTLEDIVSSEDTSEIVATNNNGILEIIYEGSVFNASSGQFIDLQDQSFSESISGITIPPGSPNIPVNRSFDISFNTTVEVDSLLLKNGSLVLTLESTFQHNIDVDIEFPGIRNANGQSLRITETLPARTGGSPTVRSSINELNNSIIDMTDGGTTINEIPINVNLTIRPVSGNPSSTNDQFRIIGNLRNLEFREFSGYLGQDSLDLITDTIGVNLFRNFKAGNLFISNPTLDIFIRNSYALPVNLLFEEIKATNNDKNPSEIGINLPIDPQTNQEYLRNLQSPTKYGLATTTENLDRTNSNVDSVISFLLKKIVYDTKAYFNPNGKTGSRNFVTDTSGIGLDVKLTFPFEGRVSNFNLIDTIDLEFDIANDLDNGTIRVIVDNGFPIDANFQLVFTDSNYVPLDSLYAGGAQNVITSAPKDVNGDAIGRTRTINEAIINRSTLSKLENSKYAFIRASLNTDNANQNQNVRFKPEYTMQVVVGLRAALLIE